MLLHGMRCVKSRGHLGTSLRCCPPRWPTHGTGRQGRVSGCCLWWFLCPKKRGEESGTWREEVAGHSQPSWNKHQDWSHEDNLEGRWFLPEGFLPSGPAKLLLCLSPPVFRKTGLHIPVYVWRIRGFIITFPASRNSLWSAIVRLANLTIKRKCCSPGWFK